MTTMESDSASQDSDDGRRFRFEATRKDSAALVDTASKVRSPKKKSKHKSSRYESSRHHHREKKERSKHEGDRKGDEKDLRYSMKHSKHDSKNSRQDDGKNSSKDHKDGRDASVGSTPNDRGSRNSSGGDEKEKSRDSKRQSDRERSIHLIQRSRERSYERNYHEEQTSGDKHKGRYHERHGHRSRERSHQSSRVKSSNDDHRSREDHGRHDSSRKTSMREDKSQNSKDYSSPIVERERSHSEARSCENTKKDSLSAQDCKDLDLSQFDVLSEIDENMSDDRDCENRISSPRDPGDAKLESATYEARENGEGANKRKREWREELSKVKKRSHDPVSSSGSNPNAVSDSSLGSTPPATILIVKDASTSSEKDKFERTITRDTSELSGLEEKSHPDVFSDETPRLEKDVEQTESTSGPLLPSRFVSNISDNDEKTPPPPPRTLDENKVGNEVTDESHKSARFIGPCRPPELSTRQNEEQEEAKDEDTAMFATEADVFGPALPPHLLQRQRGNDSQDKIIGPVLSDVKLCKESSAAELSESDEDCAIGPLPVNHPALRNSRVHEKLDLRAQKIRNERCLEEVKHKWLIYI